MDSDESFILSLNYSWQIHNNIWHVQNINTVICLVHLKCARVYDNSQCFVYLLCRELCHRNRCTRENDPEGSIICKWDIKHKNWKHMYHKFLYFSTGFYSNRFEWFLFRVVMKVEIKVKFAHKLWRNNYPWTRILVRKIKTTWSGTHS